MVDTRKGLFAIEKIALLYNLLTSVLILFLYHRMDHPGQMLVDRVLIAGMTFLLMYLYRLAPCKFSAFIRVCIQMSLLSYWYPDTYEFNRLFPNLDHLFAAAEQIFAGSGRGEEKKEYVVQWLKDRGITVDAEKIDAMIEAAVYELNQGLIPLEGVAIVEGGDTNDGD